MNIFDMAFSDLFKKRTLRVKPETNLLSVLATLGSAGVMIEGRYHVNTSSEGTMIDFLATDLQWEVIKMLFDNMDNFMKKAIEEYGLQDLFKE